MTAAARIPAALWLARLADLAGQVASERDTEAALSLLTAAAQSRGHCLCGRLRQRRPRTLH